MNEDRDQLLEALAAQERLRGSVPDDVVDASIEALQTQLDSMAREDRPVEQRRMATVLFADVAGFTALSETMDPELVAGLMNELWSVVDAVIRQQHGRVDKHIGDAVMGVWGTGLSREDDPERAVRAALALLAAFTEFRRSNDLAIDIRIGVNTGAVLSGEVGTTGELSVTGDAVNVASRIEHSASFGSVLISHGTYRHVRGLFDVRRLDPITVRGKTEPLRTYAVQGIKPRSFRLPMRGVEGVETRLIGRDDEIALLKDAYLRAIREHQVQVVTILGEAGVGKSRLLHELTTWLELRSEPVYYLKGRSLPDLQGVARGLLREVFRFRFEVLDDDPTDVVAAKLRAGLEPLDEREADLAAHWLGFNLADSDAVQDLAGAPEFNTVARAHLMRHLRFMFSQSPAVILLEDVHWADNESIDAVLHLVQQLSSTPLMVVCLARDAFMQRDIEWGDVPGSSIIRLEPLDPADQDALVHEILQRADHVPTKLVELISENADGNPFYVEELIKMLIDDGVVVPNDNDTWHIESPRLNELNVPPTLTGVLQARLDGLSASQLTTLQHASVIGRIFWDDAVAWLLDAAPAPEPTRESLSSHLNELRRRELVHFHERSVMAGCEQYVFRHALLREATYETVLLKNRAQLHAAAAAWLESRAGERLDEHLGPIADHLAQAGDYGRASELLARSAEKATATGALTAAREAYERALSYRGQIEADHDPQATRSRIELGRVLSLSADLPMAEEQLELAERDAVELGSSELLGRARCRLAEVAMQRGAWDRARECLETAQPLAEREGGELQADIELAKAWMSSMVDEPVLAVEAANSALAQCRTVGSSQKELEALNRVGVAYGQLGDFDASTEYLNEARDLAGRLGNRYREAIILNNLAATAHGRAQSREDRLLRTAIDRYREVLELDDDLGLAASGILTLVNLAQAEVEAGDLDEAAHHAHVALEGAWRSELVAEWVFSVVVHGQLAIARGQASQGLALIGAVDADPRTPRMDEELQRLFAMHGIDLADAQIGMRAGAGLDLDREVERMIQNDPNPGGS